MSFERKEVLAKFAVAVVLVFIFNFLGFCISNIFSETNLIFESEYIPPVVDSMAWNREEGILFSIYSSYGSDNQTKTDLGVGHAWLVIENNTENDYDFYNTTISAGETVSIGTFNALIDPDTEKVARKAWLNIEANQRRGINSTASLTTQITEEELATISKLCLKYSRWNGIQNCTWFASKIWNKIVSSDLKVNAYCFVVCSPAQLKKSIMTIDGHETNRDFAPSMATGYCPNSTTFKAIEPSRIRSK